MNLVLDIGNTRIKAAVFDGENECAGSQGDARCTGIAEGAPYMADRIVERLTVSGSDLEELAALLDKYPTIESVIVSSTREGKHPAEHFLAERIGHFIRFGSTTPTPLKNLYPTPSTLGSDRLAAAVGGQALCPGKNLLIIDFGTAITIDVVSASGEYLGGNISPGASMRLHALHDYTGRLPFIEPTPDSASPLSGRTTAEAIEGGVINGILFELEGYADRLRDKLGDLTVIFTGGEAKLFENKLKNTIFAEYSPWSGDISEASYHRSPAPFATFVNYDLVLIGLNRILRYNADKK